MSRNKLRCNYYKDESAVYGHSLANDFVTKNILKQIPHISQASPYKDIVLEI